MSHPSEAGYLGSAQAVGVLSQANKNVAGGWVVEFRTQDLPPIDVEVYHIAIVGPTGNMLVYIDESFYSATSRTDRNEYDPKQPMFVRRGQGVTFHLSSSSAPAPKVWMYIRTPRGGIFE